MFVADVVEVLHQEVSAFPPGTGPKPRRPYKFLDYYTEQDAPFFFRLDQFEEFFSCLPGEARRLKPELRADLCSSVFIGGFHFLQFAADESSFHRANFTNS